MGWRGALSQSRGTLRVPATRGRFISSCRWGACRHTLEESASSAKLESEAAQAESQLETALNNLKAVTDSFTLPEMPTGPSPECLDCLEKLDAAVSDGRSVGLVPSPVAPVAAANGVEMICF